MEELVAVAGLCLFLGTMWVGYYFVWHPTIDALPAPSQPRFRERIVSAFASKGIRCHRRPNGTLVAYLTTEIVKGPGRYIDSRYVELLVVGDRLLVKARPALAFSRDVRITREALHQLIAESLAPPDESPKS